MINNNNNPKGGGWVIHLGRNQVELLRESYVTKLSTSCKLLLVAYRTYDLQIESNNRELVNFNHQLNSNHNG